MSASVSLEWCVRSLSVLSGCRKCADACGVDAIAFEGFSIRIDGIKCTNCSACVAVCPTGAITVEPPSFYGISSEELFCEAVKKGGDLLFEAPCELFDDSYARADEANRLLAAFGVAAAVVPSAASAESKKPEDGSKRAFFRMFTKDGIKAAHENVKSGDELAFGVDYSLLKSKKIPPKRERFLSVVENLPLVVSEPLAISFASDKYIDDSCNNCSLCYNLCPSGALETTAMKNAIIFSPHLCLKCKLCEDVCDTKSISSLPLFDLAFFKERKKRVLKKFTAKLCPTCGLLFSSEGEECPRCAKESEDAYELLGL